MQARRDPLEGLHDVPEAQQRVDAQLRNWHDWLAGGGGGGSNTSPMFRMVRSLERQAAYGAACAKPAADERQALAVEHAIAAQPPMHAAVLRWFYYRGGSPFKVAKDIGVGKFHLVGLLRDARARLDAHLRANEAIAQAKATSKLRSMVVPV
jgi:hypothetical protein